MKILKPKLKTQIISSLLALAIVAVPFVSSADDSDKDKDIGCYFGKSKIEQRANLDAEIRLSKNSSSNSEDRDKNKSNSGWRSGILGWFTDEPVITHLTAKPEKPHKAIISWKTDVRSTTLAWYSKTSPVDTSLNSNVVRRSSLVKDHKIRLNRLEAGTTYYLVVGSSNGAGVTLSSEISFTTPSRKVTPPVVDNTAPVISGIASVTGKTSSTITWTTDEPSTSKVFYSSSTPVDVNVSSSVSDASLSTAHSLEISGLQASTLYYFIVESADASANAKTSSEAAFTTSS